MIDTHSINKVIEAYNKRNSPIVVASHAGRHGHPILLSKKLFNEIELIDEATFGLKSVVDRHESEVQTVETGSENVLLDIDTPKDLKHLR